MSTTMHENKRDHLPDFVRLNLQWIEHYFEVEPADQKMADNPGDIIDTGGFIFTLEHDGEVLGAVALINEGGGVFELAKMAVSPKAQGQGYGDLLMRACLEKLRDLGASKVHLISNQDLKPAIALYEKHGFITTSLEPHPMYQRGNIAMEYVLPSA